ELLDGVARQPGDAAVVELVGDAPGVGPREAGGVGLLTAKIAFVAELDLDALERRGARVGGCDPAGRGDRFDRAPVELGAAVELGERGAPVLDRRAAEARELRVDRIGARDGRALGALVRGGELGAPGFEFAPARIVAE